MPLFSIQTIVHVYSLRKHEILRKKQLIGELFRSRKKLKGEHIKVIFSYLETGNPDREGYPSVLFAVSRKTVPDAVRRNRIKRLMREAYRQEKEALFERKKDDGSRKKLCLAFIYTGTDGQFAELAVLRREISRLLRTIRSSRG